MGSKATNELLEILASLNTYSELKEYTTKIAEDYPRMSFSKYINSKIAEKNLSLAELIRASQIQRNYCYQILNGLKSPGKDKIIALCLALKLTIEETQKALMLAGEGALYSKNRRDAILLFSLQKQLSVLDTNEILHELNEKLLS